MYIDVSMRECALASCLCAHARWLGGRSNANRSQVWLTITLINTKKKKQKNHMNLRLGDDGS